ncbi:MAG: aldo/keto reductase [Bifidobacteriaceae bacterium]|jgi:aryl-alcohol dehydrogenase-like predicted oxidoreductase|nr:aldo/keto reductase [Bifidobacteriaceae bacterium]
MRLGNTGLEVSAIAIGAMTFGEPGRGHPVWSLDEPDSRQIIEHALEVGINFFDTANIYSHGSSEEILGRALGDFANRDDVVIATKVRHPMRPGPNGGGLSRKAVMTEIDHSLRRLGTDYVDLYQIHRLDQNTPLEETLDVLNDLVRIGKVRYLGASSMHAWEFATALRLQAQHGWARFCSMQDHYSLLAREEEHEMIPLCLDQGVGTVIWSPLARGRLARPWGRATARSARDPYADILYQSACEAADRAVIGQVGAVAEARGVTRAQVALAWLRSKPVVAAALVGANNTRHVDDAVASLDLELTADEVAALEAPYTPRLDVQGISDDAEMARIMAAVPQFTPTADVNANAQPTAPEPI